MKVIDEAAASKIGLRGYIGGAVIAVAAALGLFGCATMPQVEKGASNFLQKGMLSAKLKGNEFYMAVGDVDLYRQGMFGNLKATGKTVETSVVIQADPDTGEALKIATLQSNDAAAASPSDLQNGATVANGASYVLADLRGGISVIDIQSFPRWLDAVQAMRDAIGKLSTANGGGVVTQTAVVTVVPSFWWGGWMGFGGHPGSAPQVTKRRAGRARVGTPRGRPSTPSSSQRCSSRRT